MAWTDVPYVDVGTQITESFMDTYVKANFDALSGHAHGGASGDGSSALDNVDTVICDHQGSDPSAPTSGHGILYVKSGGVFIIQAGGSAVQVSEA
jgi:hypothetical protein|tara:strand:+ start:550 stop:834 length:285 start_codon:yes stop_codon:yes gene_type:complete